MILSEDENTLEVPSCWTGLPFDCKLTPPGNQRIAFVGGILHLNH